MHHSGAHTTTDGKGNEARDLLGAIRSIDCTAKQLPESLFGGIPLKIALSDQGTIMRQLSAQSASRDGHRSQVAVAAIRTQVEKESRLIQSLAARDAKIARQVDTRLEEQSSEFAQRRSQYSSRAKSALQIRQNLLDQTRRNPTRRGHPARPASPHAASMDSHSPTTPRDIKVAATGDHTVVKQQQHHRVRSFREEERRILQSIYSDLGRQRRSDKTSPTVETTSAHGHLHADVSDLAAALRRAEEDHLASMPKMGKTSPSQQSLGRSSCGNRGHVSASSSGNAVVHRLAQPLAHVVLSHAERIAAFDHLHGAKAKKREDTANDVADYQRVVAEHRAKHAESVNCRREAADASRTEKHVEKIENWKVRGRASSPTAAPSVSSTAFNGSFVWGRIAKRHERAREMEEREAERHLHVQSNHAGERWLRQL